MKLIPNRFQLHDNTCNKYSFLFTLTIYTLVCGCSSAPRPEYMVPSMTSVTHANSGKTLNVSMVLGGEETDELLKGSRIDKSSFLTALVQALSNSQLFTSLNVPENPDYTLSSVIISQSQPPFGIDMTVSLMVRYKLSEGENGLLLWEKDIISTYTADFGDAFIGSTRLKLANEGAVRDNLKQLLEGLASLDL